MCLSTLKNEDSSIKHLEKIIKKRHHILKMKSVSLKNKNITIMFHLFQRTKARIVICFQMVTVFHIHTEKKHSSFSYSKNQPRQNNTVKADQKTKGKMEDDCST